MKTITEHQFKKNLSIILDQIDSKNMPIIISREHKNSLVIMSKSSYEAIEEVFEIIDDDIIRLYQLYLKSKNSSGINSKNS